MALEIPLLMGIGRAPASILMDERLQIPIYGSWNLSVCMHYDRKSVRVVEFSVEHPNAKKHQQNCNSAPILCAMVVSEHYYFVV